MLYLQLALLFFSLDSVKSKIHTDKWLKTVPKLPQDGTWQYVPGTRHPLFVYSAYIERRFSELAIRIIAVVTVKKLQKKVYCRISLANSTIFTVPSIFIMLREDATEPESFIGVFIYCKIKRSLHVDEENLRNSSVEVIYGQPTKVSSVSLKVLDTKPNTSSKNEVHVCVKAIHSSYSRAAWLVEWLEANLLLGVSHFYMYNRSMSDNVSCILDYYRRLGVVTLLPWNLPLSGHKIFVYGQGAAFNDCLYRSMSRARWLLNIDLDELVFPRPKRTLPKHLNILGRKLKIPSTTNIIELVYLKANNMRHMNYLPDRKPQRPSSISFDNAFFYLKYDDDARKSVRKYPLVTSRKTRRLVYPEDFRNKYAVRPYHAVQLGNHIVWQFTGNQSIYNVEHKNGYLHHYRTGWCDMPNCTSISNCTLGDIQVDNTALQWADDLLSRVKLKRYILNSCLSSNLSYVD